MPTFRHWTAIVSAINCVFTISSKFYSRIQYALKIQCHRSFKSHHSMKDIRFDLRDPQASGAIQLSHRIRAFNNLIMCANEADRTCREAINLQTKSLGAQKVISNRKRHLLAVDLPRSSTGYQRCCCSYIFPRTSFHDCLFCSLMS